MTGSTSARPRLLAERSVHSTTLGAMVAAATDRHQGVLIRSPRPGGGAATWTGPQFGGAARALARGFIALGINAGDRVGVLGATSYEWTLTDCALQLAGAVTIPVYHTSSAEQIAYVLDHAGARSVVCAGNPELDKIRSIRERCPQLQELITMTPTGQAPSLDDLRDRAAEVDAGVLEERIAGVRPDDVATIVYTSGTTGPPKGCELTHANVLAAMEMYELELELGDDAVVFVFLPLAHVLARVTQFVAIDVGATLAFWSGDPANLLGDVIAAQPTHLPAVPRMFEKIHTKAFAAASDGGSVRRRLFHRALGIGRRHALADEPGAVLRAQHAIADRLVLRKVRDLFGGRLELALTGAAPIDQGVLEFFRACGILVLEGYGLTETCAAATLNTPDAHRFGTVGRALPRTELRIGEDGEVLIRGPQVFGGYHRSRKATAETLDAEGWLHTGDLGALDADGYLRITGRKKDLIITSSGKNISPSNIETALRESRWISQAVVLGDGRPYLVALLTLDPDEAPALAGRLGIEPDVAAMADDPRVRAELQQHVDAVNGDLARIEQVKRFAVLDHDLSQDADELTPTLKVKRPVVADHYGAVVERLYG